MTPRDENLRLILEDDATSLAHLWEDAQSDLDFVSDEDRAWWDRYLSDPFFRARITGSEERERFDAEKDALDQHNTARAAGL